MKRVSHNVIVIIGLVVCSYDLIQDEIRILIGHNDFISITVLYPACKYLVHALGAPGSDLLLTTHYWFALAWLVCYVVFFLAFWECNRSSAKHDHGKLMALLSVQIVAALISQGDLVNAVAPQLAYRLPRRKALRWLAVLVTLSWLSVAPYLLELVDMGPVGPVFKWYFPLQILRDEVIYFAMGYVALAVTRNRNRLAAANTKLLATRQLLGEAVRASERLRIARALNDLIGHHLSALNLHLDLAVRQSGDRVAASICTAADLGKRLMADVRVAIGNERDEHSIDLRQALQTLCSGVPLPRIALDIAADFELVSPKIAHALFCCTQEAITNAMRHANAGAVAISLTRDANAVGLTIEDDGRGMGSRPEGNGLRGLRERIAGHGGSIAISDSLAGGCRIVIHVPHSGESV